jgi:zinc resistance-associated protein
MWKALVAGTTLLTIAGSALASAQQPPTAERSHRAQLTADDIAAFTDARIAAIKAALKLTPAQEKNWPAVAGRVSRPTGNLIVGRWGIHNADG